MKNMVGKEAKLYNYINNVFMTISDYYNYEFMEMPMIMENVYERDDNLGYVSINDSNLILRPSLEVCIRNYYLNNIKSGIKKYCYSGNVYVNGKEKRNFGFLAAGINSVYQDAEMVSMLYRLLEELKLDNILVKVQAYKKYDLKKLQEYLGHLDVDYELEESDELIDEGTLLRFNVVEQVGDKEILLATGSKSKDKFEAISCTCDLDNILEILSVIYENHDFDNLAKVYIISESEEERIVGMKLAQDLRWCEIKVDIDVTNKSRAEQKENVHDANFMVDINKEDLNKGLIKVIDFLTKEETLVDENEIIDYIASNI